jgi:hypothetical protein
MKNILKIFPILAFILPFKIYQEFSVGPLIKVVENLILSNFYFWVNSRKRLPLVQNVV